MVKKHETYYGINETAGMLGISRDVLLRELEEGKIEAHLRGKRVKFRQDDIDKYIERQKINNSAWSKDYVPKHLKKMKLF